MRTILSKSTREIIGAIMTLKTPFSISLIGVANFLGVIGVIGSLIFVGLELRQTQLIALADMEQRRSEQVTNRALAFLTGESEAFANLRGKPESELSLKDQFLREMQWSWSTQMQQNTLFQYQAGFISETQWRVIAERILQSWEDCSTRSLYNSRFLEAAFVEYLQALPDRCTD
jgi:hypothetical protein